MGIFRESLPNHNFFQDLGFKYKNGATGQRGWTKTIEHNDNEILWITIDNIKNKIYLYNEWDIGGILYEKEINIPYEVLDNKEIFIDWLDYKIDEIGE